MLNYKTICAPDTFIGAYMTRMDGVETARAYDFWCACWVLSSLLGRRLFVDRPRIPVFLNMYLILVAESGTTRKSTAVSYARKLYNIMRPDDHVLIEGKVTPEKLESLLAINGDTYGHSHGTICVSEMVTFLGREKYTMQLPGMLTDLYDCPKHRIGGGAMSRRGVQLRDVYITFLSASTASWLNRAINPDIVEGGFTSRTLFIVDERRKKRIAWPNESDGNGADISLQEMLGKILTISKRIDKIILTEKAITRFKSWYNAKRESTDAYRKSFESREDDHVLRVASLLACNDLTFVVEKRHIEKALRAIESAKSGGASLFAGNVVTSTLLDGIDRVRSKLLDVGVQGIQHAKLYNYARRYLTSDEFTIVMDLLHEHDMVQRFEVALSKVAKKKATWWRATNKIVDGASLESVSKSLDIGD